MQEIGLIKSSPENIYLSEGLFCKFFPEHKVPHSWSPPWTPFRVCWRSETTVASDFILVEPDGQWQFLLLFIYLWLCWVFVSVRGLSLVAASGGHSSSRCACLSLSRPLLLRSKGSRRAGSAIVAHGPSCSAAGGILPDQGSNPCPLHWQADSQPVRHQGSPPVTIFSWDWEGSWY